MHSLRSYVCWFYRLFEYICAIFDFSSYNEKFCRRLSMSKFLGSVYQWCIQQPLLCNQLTLIFAMDFRFMIDFQTIYNRIYEEVCTISLDKISTKIPNKRKNAFLGTLQFFINFVKLYKSSHNFLLNLIRRVTSEILLISKMQVSIALFVEIHNVKTIY